MYENESDLSLIGQLDGNMTNLSDVNIYDNSRTYHFEYRVITSKDRDYNDLDMMDSAKRHYNNEKYNTYEEALEKGLTEALKLILLKHKQ